MTTHPLIPTLALAALATSAPAQTDIDSTHKYSWGENIGYMNWADANNGVQGVQIKPSYLAGYIWGENVGWIRVGDGTPGGGSQYTNASGADHGVNIEPNGDLWGYAWGENIGWVNFDTRDELKSSGKQARFDGFRFRGYAWGENVGWINLDDDDVYVGAGGECEADCNGDGSLNILDFVCFQNLFKADSPGADCNGDGSLNILDFVCYQNAFKNGCP
jgi:hypothetical protein